MRGWPEEVIAWLRDNVPGRSTKQVTELINQQGFDKKYGMVFSDAAIKGAKNRYGIKSGTTGGVPKGYSLKYPEGMESYIRSIAVGKKTKEIAELVSAHFGIEFSEKQCKAYKKNHDIISGVDCRFEKGHVPANKGKPMSQVVYMTTKPKTDLPTHVYIESALRPSTLLCEQISTVSEERIGEWIGELTDDEVKELDVALAISLGMKCRPGQADADTLERLNNLQMELERTKAELKEAKSGPDYKMMYDQLIEKMLSRR